MARDSGDSYNISIDDDLSGCRVIEVKMTATQFAEAVTSLYTHCEFDLNVSGNVGKKHEWKKEYIAILNADKAKAKQALKPFEVDGWVGRVNDLFNCHNRTKDGYMVGFDRWVELKP